MAVRTKPRANPPVPRAKRRAVAAKVEEVKVNGEQAVVDAKEVKAAKRAIDNANKVEERAKGDVAAARAKAAQAREELDKFLAPLRAEVNTLTAEKAKASMKATELNEQKKAALAVVRDADEKLGEIYAKVEAMGIPRVLLGIRRKRRAAVHGARNVVAGRKTLKPDMVGEFDPIEITASRKQGNHDKECTIVVSSDGHTFNARKGTKDDGNPNTAFSHRLSDVTQATNWLETKDVAYAILYALGKLDEFPAMQPVSDPATIKVNGETINADRDYKFEAVANMPE